MRNLINKESQPRSHLTKKIRELLSDCQIQIEYVNPNPLGAGISHICWLYTPPDGPQKVIKIPTFFSYLALNHGAEKEKRNIRTVQKYFPEFTVPCEVKESPRSGRYCVLMDFVEGKPLESLDLYEPSQSRRDNPKMTAVGQQMGKFMESNSHLMNDLGLVVDFTGKDGFTDSLRSLVSRGKSVRISNILVDPNNERITLIDYDLINLKHKFGFNRLSSKFTYNVNKIILRRNFRINL